jgi:hypothetical protein
METGLILLAAISVLCTVLFVKGRRKMGLGVTSKHWVVAFLVVFFLILVIWANGHT